MSKIGCFTEDQIVERMARRYGNSVAIREMARNNDVFDEDLYLPKKYSDFEGTMPTDFLNKMLTMGHSTVVDNNNCSQVMQQFVASSEGDVLRDSFRITVGAAEHNYFGVVTLVKAMLSQARAVMPFEDQVTYIYGKRDDVDTLVIVSGAGHMRNMDRTDDEEDDREDHARAITFSVLGAPEVVKAVRHDINDAFKEAKIAQLVWWTKGPHTSSRSFFLPKDSKVLHPEFYPDMGNPEKYIEDYLKSDESILLMAGPPGTGKTTLLRSMIAKHGLCAHIVYDEGLMKDDTVFQSFLFSKQSDLMVIEDADTVIHDRENDGNKLMSRFLNVSDGLIKLPNKKLIFTTNISDMSKVDQALMRPGRCFGTLHTRLLNLSEAQAAAKVAGLPVPMERREYSLAELFNQGKRQAPRRLGFGFGV